MLSLYHVPVWLLADKAAPISRHSTSLTAAQIANLEHQRKYISQTLHLPQDQIIFYSAKENLIWMCWCGKYTATWPNRYVYKFTSKKLHNPRLQHPPLPANLYGREFFICDHLAHLLARGLEQGSGFFYGQDFIVRHNKTSSIWVISTFHFNSCMLILMLAIECQIMLFKQAQTPWNKPLSEPFPVR